MPSVQSNFVNCDMHTCEVPLWSRIGSRPLVRYAMFTLIVCYKKCSFNPSFICFIKYAAGAYQHICKANSAAEMNLGHP